MESTREIAERMVQADPSVSAAEIARQTGVSRQRIQTLLSEMGYELVQVWRKRKRKAAIEG